MKWQNRVKSYEKLNWVKDKELLDAILKTCNATDISNICDIGTGTGIVANHIAPFCKQVDAIDKNKAMMKKRKNQFCNNVFFYQMDAEELDITENSYDIVVSRMCFHHIDNPQHAIKECYRILKPGGNMVLCEAIPPYCCYQFYVELFEIKEKRHVFTSDDLIFLFELAGFSSVDFSLHVMKQVSIRNWITNNALWDSKQKKLFDMWKNSPDYIKQIHNLVLSDDDILVDWLFMIVRGIK